MVMEKEYGRDEMRRFLKYELDRYLAGRGGELVGRDAADAASRISGTSTTARAAWSMYALRDEIGEDSVNAALRQLISRSRVRTAAVRDDARSHRRLPRRDAARQAVADQRSLRDDHALRQPSRGGQRNAPADGKYDVNVTVESKKFRADDRGQETAMPVHDWVDIGVLGEEGPKK